ncbi:MAG: phosphate acyltransferase PlsX [Gammaproteobacteria bacterium]|nr:phosphate acyltransferase PlsX [Gammaproteobacteria bacterium]
MESFAIALDAMGGDHGPEVVVPAAIDALDRHPGLRLVLVGNEQILAPLAASAGEEARHRLTIRHASQMVGMDESPAAALRGKRDSSMRVAIDLVKQGTAAACVSAGNTGALMAMAKFVLHTLPGIDRPAIATALPTMKGHVHVLDLGANVDVTPAQLVQFAIMGSDLTSAVEHKAAPRVALLNIGAEAIKGNETVKQASALMADTGLNYIGYVEGDGIFTGEADVVVCDGFVGNVALKTSEGVAKMISHYLKLEFGRNLVTRMAGLVALPVLRSLKLRLDPRRYNGASLLGLQGIVIKSHGGADRLAFTHAIDEAVNEVANDVPARIRNHMQQRLEARAAS